MSQVHICEVGPRDGLQNAKHLMPTAAKKTWIKALADAGLKEIEVGSFVPPKLIPAMADTGEVVAFARTIPGLKVVALAPNLKGFQRALDAGAHKVTFPVSASRQHSESNVRMTPEQMVEEVRKCAAFPHSGVEIEGAVSTAFGCTMQGVVPEDDVVRIAKALAGFCDSVALADTVGYANPAQVRRVFSKVRKAIGGKLEGAHFHNTRGLGLANAVAAYEEGVRSFDSSLGGLGAEVIKVEPLEGDNTRRLDHAGAGFYPVFNRNKKSFAVDLKHPEGNALVLKLIERSDVLTENFRPGALDKLGFSYDKLK